MPDDKLRIGGWVPPNEQDTRPLPVLPSQRGTALERARDAELVPVGPDRRAGRVILLCALAVVAGTVGMLALLRPSQDKQADPPLAEPMVFNTPSELPTSPPSPSPSYQDYVPPAGNPTTPARPYEPPTAATTTRGAHPSPTTRKPRPPAAPSLTPGSVVSLEVEGRSGLRIRHQNFTVRVDKLTSASSPGDRADARFTVRRGLASGGCLSFEAVNHPGYYLRHRVYDMILDRRDRSTLFDQESTFCARPTRDGKAFTLVTFYPDTSYGVWVQWDGRVQVAFTGYEPTRWVVRKPL
jgi:hypothetical protein